MDVIVCTPADARFSTYFPGVPSGADYLLCGIVLSDQEAVIGSLCLYDNPFILHEGMQVMLLGNFHCIDDPHAAGILFDKAAQIARLSGKEFLAGPMNGSVWGDYRLPLTGDGPMFTGDLGQPLYYAGLFAKHGFDVIHQYYSAISSTSISKAEIELPADILLRNLDLGNLSNELDALYPICETAFSGNPFFSPISKAEFIKKYLSLRPLLDGRLQYIAMSNGVPIAFLFAYGDPQNKEQVVVKTAAKHPEHNVPGLMSHMSSVLFAHAAALGYQYAIHAFMHAHNRSLLRSRDFSGSPIRTYGLFGKKTGG